MRRLWILLIAAIPVLLRPVSPSGTSDLSWWTMHALQKVRPDDSEPQDPKRSVKIYAARNEFEPFQVVLHAERQDIEGVDVDVTDLDGPAGKVIPKSAVYVYFERYLDLKTPSSIEGGAGEWPDPLIPRVDHYAHEKRNAFPFRLTKGRNQPVWIEVYVPKSTSPGIYRGQARIIILDRLRVSIPVELEVWNFELPSTSSLVTTFGFNGIGALQQHFGKYTNDQQLYELSSLYRKAALWHRISIHGASGMLPAAKIVDGQVQVSWKDFDSENGPFMDGRVFSADEPLYGARATSVALRTPPYLKTHVEQIQYWQQVGKHFREKGWFDRLFNYLWDEPKPSDYPAMIELGQIVHRGDPEIKNLVTAPLHQEWSNFVDIWTPAINCFERKPGHGDYCDRTVERTAYDAELANGKRLWWYQACGSHGCYIVGGNYFRGWPSYEIDHDAVRNRIMEWLSWKYNISGELYFNMDEAFWEKDPWKDVHLFGGNGDGILFYPGRSAFVGGTTDIPIESMRLKLIREGLEDYEYFVMLSKSRGTKTVADAIDGLIRHIYAFDHHPEKLYSIRQWMGAELSRLSN